MSVTMWMSRRQGQDRTPRSSAVLSPELQPTELNGAEDNATAEIEEHTLEAHTKRIQLAWDDPRRERASKCKKANPIASESGTEPVKGVLPHQDIFQDGILISVCVFTVFLAGKFNMSFVWMCFISLFILHIVYSRLKDLTHTLRHERRYGSLDGKPTVSDQDTWVNGFIEDLWPRHILLLEERLKEAVSKKVENLRATGISDVKLLRLRVLRGIPTAHDLRGHVEPPVPGGTSIRARPSHNMDQVLDALINFDGLVEMIFFVQLMVGSVTVRVKLTHCQCHARLRFYNRLEDRPFFGGFTAEVLPFPEAIFDFNVKVGYVTATRVPFIEDFFLNQMQRLVRNSRVDFSLARMSSEPEKVPFTPEGLLMVSVRHIKQSSNCADPTFERRIRRTTLELQMGDQKKIFSVIASPNSAMAFVVSPFVSDIYNYASNYVLKIRVLDSEREAARGRVNVEDVIVRNDTACIDWEMNLKPSKTFASVRFTFLWEPLVHQRFIDPFVAQQGILLWAKAREGLVHQMPVGIELPGEHVGILRVAVKRAFLYEDENSLLQTSSEAAGQASSFEWNPFVTVSMSDTKYATKAPGKQSGRPASVEWKDVFEFLVSVDDIESLRLVFRVFDRRWSSSSLLGSTILDVQELIFAKHCFVEESLALDKGDVGAVDVLVTFQPSTMVHGLGQRANFWGLSLGTADTQTLSKQKEQGPTSISNLFSKPQSAGLVHSDEFQQDEPSVSASEPVDAVADSVDDTDHDAVENVSEENASGQPDIDAVEQSPERKALVPERTLAESVHESASLEETSAVEDSQPNDVEDVNQEQLFAQISQDIELSDFSPATPLRHRKRAESDRALQRDAANPPCSAATEPAADSAQQCVTM